MQNPGLEKIRMKRFSKESLLIAVSALLILPVQQIFLKNTCRSGRPVELRKEYPDPDWSSNALGGNAGGVIQMVYYNLRQNKIEAAEAWLKFGCFELRAPSVMLFYGDWLKQKGNIRRAEYFYRFALKKAECENAPREFINTIKKRLGERL